MQKDTIDVEILDDGTVRFTTSKVSAPNHANAETLLRDIGAALGGVGKVEKRVKSGHHYHQNKQEVSQ